VYYGAGPRTHSVRDELSSRLVDILGRSIWLATNRINIFF